MHHACFSVVYYGLLTFVLFFPKSITLGVSAQIQVWCSFRCGFHGSEGSSFGGCGAGSGVGFGMVLGSFGCFWRFPRHGFGDSDVEPLVSSVGSGMGSGLVPVWVLRDSWVETS